MKESQEDINIINSYGPSLLNCLNSFNLGLGSIKRLNFYNKPEPFQIKSLFYKKILLVLDNTTGTPFSRAGLKIFQQTILDKIKEYNPNQEIKIQFRNDFVLEENVDFRQLNMKFHKLQIDFNSRMLYKTIWRGGFNRYYERNDKTNQKFIVPYGTEILNNQHNIAIEYY